MRLTVNSTVNRSFTLVVVVALAASACGGDDAEPEADQPAVTGAVADPQDSTTSDGGDDGVDNSAEPTDDGAEPTDDGAEPTDDGASGEVASAISWVAPDGMTPSTMAISPDGSQVAVSFAAPLGSVTASAEVIVYDVTSGAEVWRYATEDGGLYGYGDLVFTSAGLTAMSSTFEGVQLVRFDATGTPNTDVMVEAGSPCGQFLNGTVDLTSDVYYTVIPSGFCRVDISTGATTELKVEDIEAGSQVADSIRFGSGGVLVASFPNADFEARTVAIDPVSFTAQGDAGQPEPASAGDLFGDRLQEGVNLSSDSRAVSTPDGSVTALLQPATIEVIS